MIPFLCDYDSLFRCHTSYVTNYDSQQEEECEEIKAAVDSGYKRRRAGERQERKSVANTKIIAKK